VHPLGDDRIGVSTVKTTVFGHPETIRDVFSICIQSEHQDLSQDAEAVIDTGVAPQHLLSVLLSRFSVHVPSKLVIGQSLPPQHSSSEHWPSQKLREPFGPAAAQVHRMWTRQAHHASLQTAHVG
jgi:hypothetical protein